MNKAQFLQILEEEHQQWLKLLAEVGEDRMDQPGVAGDWSVKDIIIHITGWRHYTVMRLQAVLRGEPGSPPPWPANLKSDDEINEWIYQRGHHLTVTEALTDSEQVFQHLWEAVASFPEEEFIHPTHFPWLSEEIINGTGLFAHFHEEHEPDIRRWLAKQESQGESNKA